MEGAKDLRYVEVDGRKRSVGDHWQDDEVHRVVDGGYAVGMIPVKNQVVVEVRHCRYVPDIVGKGASASEMGATHILEEPVDTGMDGLDDQATPVTVVLDAVVAYMGYVALGFG